MAQACFCLDGADQPKSSLLHLEILFVLPHFQQEGATEEEGQWEAREAETEREEKEDSHTCARVCVCSWKHTPPKDAHTGTAAAIEGATAVPSAVWYEK